ncbi:MAG: serine hydrolase [bacterium]|nr:serine hydrolase [bacterium]
MNKKIVCLLLGLTVIVSGCSSADPDIISYQSNETNLVSLAEDKQENLFSTELAVIDEKEQDAADKEMTSSASILVNRTTKEVAYANNVYEKLYPASLTKLATALMTLKYGNLEDMVTISYDASHITESGAKLCGFSEGDQVSLETLLHLMLVYSGNDAAMAAADYLYENEENFCEEVNRELKALGATNTHFVNSHGLDNKEHYTTAYDLYLIFNELFQYDQFKSIINEKSYKAEYTTKEGKQVLKYFANTNQYLLGLTNAPNDVTVIGGKTGTTSFAGNCLILFSTDQKGDEYISLVLNANGKADLYRQMNHLLSKIS